MDSMKAFAVGQATRGNECRVFDWDKAARRIRETGCKVACAGLRSDWEWTGGEIYSAGKPNTDAYTYLMSTWAIPELELDGTVEPCFKMEHEAPDWNASTKWPESALKILCGED